MNKKGCVTYEKVIEKGGKHQPVKLIYEQAMALFDQTLFIYYYNKAGFL